MGNTPHPQEPASGRCHHRTGCPRTHRAAMLAVGPGQVGKTLSKAWHLVTAHGSHPSVSWAPHLSSSRLPNLSSGPPLPRWPLAVGVTIAPSRSPRTACPELIPPPAQGQIHCGGWRGRVPQGTQHPGGAESWKPLKPEPDPKLHFVGGRPEVPTLSVGPRAHGVTWSMAPVTLPEPASQMGPGRPAGALISLSQSPGNLQAREGHAGGGCPGLPGTSHPLSQGGICLWLRVPATWLQTLMSDLDGHTGPVDLALAVNR